MVRVEVSLEFYPRPKLGQIDARKSGAEPMDRNRVFSVPGASNHQHYNFKQHLDVNATSIYTSTR